MGEVRMQRFAERLTVVPAVAVHLFFALLLIATVIIGRTATLGESGLAILWPATGIGFLWGLWAFDRGVGRWVPYVAVVPVIVAVNLATGLTSVLAVATAVASLAQMAVAVVLYRRVVPSGTIRVLSEYLRLGVVALIACTVGGLVTAVGSALAGNPEPLDVTIPWLVRHAVSLATIGSLGIVVGTSIRARSRGEARPSAVAARRAELLLLCLVSAALYTFTFGAGVALPLAWATVPAHMWAGLRLRAGWAMLHGLACGTVLVLFTLQGRGPFQDLGPDAAAYVAQSFMFITFSLAAVLALSMDERRRLIARLYRATAEAAAAAALRDLVIGKMNDGVLVAGPDRRLLFQNEVSEQWLGPRTARPGEVWRREYEVTKADGTALGETENPLSLALEGTSTERMDVDLTHRSGEIMHLSVDSVPLPDGQGALVVMRNVTDERLHQRDLSRFAAVVAHDLLTPLTVFDGWLEILEDPELPAAERQASIERLQRASLRMRSLIRNLLAYSLAKEERLSATRIDVGRMAGGIVDLRTALPGTQLPEIGFAVDAPVPVYADERLFLQLLENLIGNAIKYGRTDGRATVHVSTTVDRATGRTLVKVRDNGIGVPEGDLERIFEEFHRSENGLHQASGTGLGLAICRRIVESHGGTLRARNLAEGGTEFTASMPGSPEQLPGGIPFVGAEADAGAEAATEPGADTDIGAVVEPTAASVPDPTAGSTAHPGVGEPAHPVTAARADAPRRRT